MDLDTRRTRGPAGRAHGRRKRRSSAEVRLHAPAGSLSAEQREWLRIRAEQAGGLAEAFVRLVRLNILTDAWIACCDESRAVREAVTGASAVEVAHCVREVADRRAVAPLMTRLLCAMTWGRPDARRNASPYDDPAHPLPHSLTRRLIAEGRQVCDASSAAARAGRKRSRRNAPLRGLSRAEATWLARKASALGGLDAALCALVRNGFDHERIGRALHETLAQHAPARRPA